MLFWLSVLEDSFLDVLPKYIKMDGPAHMGSFFGLRSAFFFCKFFNRNTLPQKILKETARNTLYNRTTKSRPQGGFEDA